LAIATVAPDKQSVLLPGSSTQTGEQQAVQMFEQLLTYISQRPAQFEFWFDLIKEQYLTAFYPDVCKRVGIIDERESRFTLNYAYTTSIILY
jgi:hypothetical protein